MTGTSEFGLTCKPQELPCPPRPAHLHPGPAHPTCSRELGQWHLPSKHSCPPTRPAGTGLEASTELAGGRTSAQGAQAILPQALVLTAHQPLLELTDAAPTSTSKCKVSDHCVRLKLTTFHTEDGLPGRGGTAGACVWTRGLVRNARSQPRPRGTEPLRGWVQGSPQPAPSATPRQ